MRDNISPLRPSNESQTAARFSDWSLPKHARPFSSSLLWSENAKQRRCTRFELFLLCLAIVLIGLLFGVIAVWFVLFDGYRAIRQNLSWNSDDIVSVSSSVAVDSSAVHSNFKVCTSRECTSTSALFLSNMNEKIEPCTNMFEFACNNYNSNKLQSTIEDLQTATNRKLKRLLETEASDKPWEKLVKTFYSKCVNEDELSRFGKQPMIDLLERIGGWPLLKEEWSEFAGNWETYLASVVNKTGIHSILMELTVGFDPINSSRIIIELDQPKFGFEGWTYVSDEENPAQGWYIQLINDIATEMKANASQLGYEVEELVELEMNMVRSSTDEALRNDPHHTNNRFTLKELQDLFPELDLNAYIEVVFKDIVQLDENDTIILREVNYFRGIQKIMRSASKRSIANYVGWRVIQNYSIFLPKSIRQPFQKYRSKLAMEENESDRWVYCVSLAVGLLDAPVGKMLVEHSSNMDFAQTKTGQIIEYLKTVFINELNLLDWIGNETKEKIIKKTTLLTYDLGYPSVILNDSWMQSNWNCMGPAESSDEHLLILAANIKQCRLSKELGQYKKAPDRGLWFQSPAQVDAASYIPSLNKMTIPASLMQFPFLSKNIPNYITFAMIGTIISHEFSHAFCSHGIKYDQEGNLKAWLDKETTRRYKDRAECFIRQYDKAAGPKNQRRGGQFFLSENLADNIGLKLAYKAYKLWQNDAGEVEPSLPGFQNYTNERMFFISYTNNWCSSTTHNNLNNGDTHSSFHLRANTPLQNLEEFSEAFECPSNSQMDPIQKCSLW